MDTDSLAFIEKNQLSFHADFTDATPYVVTNPQSVGLIPPGRIRGTGATLAEALASYMAVLVDERGTQKEPLAEYVKEPTADAVVVECVDKDAKMPPPKVEPVEDDELPVKEG